MNALACEIDRHVPNVRCELLAVFVVRDEGSRLCAIHRRRYFTLDEVEPLEKMPRPKSLFDNNMSLTLVTNLGTHDLRPVLRELVDSVVEDMIELTDRVMKAVAAAQNALGVQ
jgi:hypothetical protein